jgi:hypothetical protein
MFWIFFIKNLLRRDHIMCKKICSKIIASIVVVIALALAIVSSIWHQEVLTYIMDIHRFFDVMIPILAVGALVKYLLCGTCKCVDHDSCCHKQEQSHSCDKQEQSPSCDKQEQNKSCCNK